MSRLRFLTAREVFESFPGLADDIRSAATADAPTAFVRNLAAGDTPEDALTFCAYALARREAVWWGCQCVRAVAEIRPGEEDPSLLAAEAWVREPDDEHRIAALTLGNESDRRGPTPWLALGAGWSGGNISLLGGASVPSKPDMTPKAVRTAILVALARVGAKERAPRLNFCVEGGLRLMQHEAQGA
ncbi:DUF6931 family protein [Enterovirga aerilata]|uniref:Uncharacterized protein n=1 Tax=Enterovirga aerilata TaxID=2730920 RepID=A0A849I5B6_9HYPH|nr:hypothetical protein [Enterovirga sp. DB1703]NNM74642.1 hypothetical protein [Enterovirga sp. DB1703]